MGRQQASLSLSLKTTFHDSFNIKKTSILSRIKLPAPISDRNAYLIIEGKWVKSYPNQDEDDDVTGLDNGHTSP
jgi:hypothetical protein